MCYAGTCDASPYNYHIGILGQVSSRTMAQKEARRLTMPEGLRRVLGWQTAGLSVLGQDCTWLLLGHDGGMRERERVSRLGEGEEGRGAREGERGKEGEMEKMNTRLYQVAVACPSCSHGKLHS